MMQWTQFFVLVSFCVVCNNCQSLKNAVPTFTIVGDDFVKDGQKIQLVSGGIHYFRVPPELWADRLRKIRASGMNTIQTYIEWSGHQPDSDVFNFQGMYDVGKFLTLAKEQDLLVVLRPGPYICAERDNGGLPYWLIRDHPGMKYRTSDANYLAAITKYYEALMPRIKPHLYENGGSIVMVQIENEYGQYDACDHTYMNFLVNITRSYLGPNVIFSRANSPGTDAYRCDKADDIQIAAGDFGSGSNVGAEFQLMREAQNGTGPMYVAEYYPGWMDHWGYSHAKVDHTAVIQTFDQILSKGGSVNMYMFHGGTNFGFSNGANGPYSPQPTSYDYGAPLSEAGDPTDLYFSLHDVILKYLPDPNVPVPNPAPKQKSSIPALKCVGNLDQLIELALKLDLTTTISSPNPKTFEELNFPFGYVLYESVIPDGAYPDPALLEIDGLADRAYVRINSNTLTLSRDLDVTSGRITARSGDRLRILIENMGRINYGTENYDPKGILKNVTINGVTISNWTMTPLPLQELVESGSLPNGISNPDCNTMPALFSTTLDGSNFNNSDTFLDPTGWTKGVAFLNNFNLGRYWTIGPQITLYVPGTLFKPDKNTLFVFETEATSGDQTMKFIDVPILDHNTPFKISLKQIQWKSLTDSQRLLIQWMKNMKHNPSTKTRNMLHKYQQIRN